MSKHTPGPWRVEGRMVMAMKEKSVAECPCGGIMHGKVDEANARLIAASPELLAACKRVLQLTPLRGGEAFRKVQAAVAKATGGVRVAVALVEERTP